MSRKRSRLCLARQLMKMRSQEPRLPAFLLKEKPAPASYAWKKPSTHHRVKLPKMDLPKSDGTVTKWTPFGDSFDDDEELSLVDKFNYLSSCLSSEAVRAVAWLSVAAVNYTAAIEILKERFGNKQLIFSQLMDGLLNFSPLSSGENAWSTRQLRVLYDNVESQIWSLEGLGVSNATYGTLLSSILRNKLPADLRLIISRQLQPWTKKKNHPRDSRREEHCSKCDIKLDHAWTAQGKSRGQSRFGPCPALIARDRAWYRTWNSVLLAANLEDGSFFFFVQGSTRGWGCTAGAVGYVRLAMWAED